MSKNKILKDALLIVSILVVSRLIPHWPNFTALGATVILAPRWLKDNRWALVAPLLAMIITDAILGFHETMFYTYLSVFLVSWLASNAADSAKEDGLSPYAGWTVLWSALFFIITNLGSWLTLEMYPKTASGLAVCFWNALPFLGYEFLGTCLYVAMAVGVRRLWARSVESAACH
jgi:hypothetical protein